MKSKGQENFIYRGCGAIITLVGPTGAFSFPSVCRRWRCPECRRRLIEEHLRDIRSCFARLRCLQVFVGSRKEDGKELSNFCNRNLRGCYVRIRCLGETVIISDRKFPGARRHDKKKFLREALPVILDRPWYEGTRVAYSRGFKKVPAKEPVYYARVFYDAAEEYKSLRSKKDKAQWIAACGNIRIFAKGREFLQNEL
jgi:hypothetical protein